MTTTTTITLRDGVTPLQVAAKYRQIRKNHRDERARDALLFARLYFKERPPIGKTFQRDGWDVLVTIDYDPNADMSFYGKWSETWEPGAIKNLDGWYGPDYTEKNGHFYPWFVPGYDYDGDIAGNRRRMGRHEAWLRAQEFKRKDMAYLKDGTSYFLRARVYREGIELGEAAVYGTDTSDDWQTYGDDESQVFDSTGEDVISEAIDDAETNLAKLVGTAR